MVKVFHLPFLIVFKPSFSWKDVYIRPHFFTRVFTGISPITKEVDQQWKKIIEAFPENVPLTKVTCPAEDEQKYTINKRTSKKTLNAPPLRKNYQRVISKPQQKALTGQYRGPGLKEHSSFALIFSAWENCPGIFLFAHTKLQ